MRPRNPSLACLPLPPCPTSGHPFLFGRFNFWYKHQTTFSNKQPKQFLIPILYSFDLVLKAWLANLSLITKVFFRSLGLVDLALHILQIFLLLHTSHILHMLQIRHILHFCFLFWFCRQSLVEILKLKAGSYQLLMWLKSRNFGESTQLLLCLWQCFLNAAAPTSFVLEAP